MAVASGTAAPKAALGWDVLPVPGGWLRYNATLEKLDSHCNRHGRDCKMDGQLSKGILGLHLAWLGATADSKHEHDKCKAPLSRQEELARRQASRKIFMHLAQVQGGVFQQVVDHEFRLRKNNDEPLSVPGYHHKVK